MNEDILLDKLNKSLEIIINILELDLSRVSENISRFSSTIHDIEFPVAFELLNNVNQYSDLFDISISGSIQNGTFGLKLANDGRTVISEPWQEDLSLTISELSTDTIDKYNETIGFLSEQGKSIDLDHLRDLFISIENGGGEISLELRIYLDKNEFLKKLNTPKDIQKVLYISSEKLINEISTDDLLRLTNIFNPQSEHTTLMLIWDTTGFTEGTNLYIYGRDSWEKLGVNNISFDANKLKMFEILKFRKEECMWEIPPSDITPYHLKIDSPNISNEKIPIILANHRDRLCITYLANRTKLIKDKLSCEFYGYKRVEIKFPDELDRPFSEDLFSLFHWAYENSSSDKLGIVRQIISLQLSDNSLSNYKIIKERAKDVLRSSKSNFQFFLKRSVELYFDKRIKVSEFIQEFNVQIKSNINKLVSDLINDLYKTIGIFIGAIVFILIDPEQLSTIAFLASLLYLFYIFFSAILLLYNNITRFIQNWHEYEHTKKQFEDVLLKEEIDNIVGNLVDNLRKNFISTAIFVGIGYFCLIALSITLLFITSKAL